jgi:archaellin|tara:strand:- start:2002 stop:2451 length:450 start_codon:yes stop_codon:yes gene_type:complete
MIRFGGTTIWSAMCVVVASVIPATALAVPVVPNFQQGSMTSHTETTSKVVETINSMDYNTGYQYSSTGSGIEPVNGTLSPTTGSTSVTIDGVTSSWTGVTDVPQFRQTTQGGAFQFTETYSGPGLQNHTIIQRTTEVTSITDTTSIFSQ